MEIEKVVRILTILLAVAAAAVWGATRLMFPDSSDGFNLPPADRRHAAALPDDQPDPDRRKKEQIKIP